jgi:hypothetical protein
MGEGLATKALENALNEIDARQVPFTLLFSEPRKLYERLGFVPLGTDVFVRGQELRAVLDSFEPESNSQYNFQFCLGTRLVEGRTNLFARKREQLFSAEMAYSPGELSLLDWDEFVRTLTIPNQYLFWLEDAEEKVVAIVRYEKGCDFRRTLFGLFGKSYEAEKELLKRVLEYVDPECLLLEGRIGEFENEFLTVVGRDVRLQMRTNNKEVFEHFSNRIMAVRGLQSC